MGFVEEAREWFKKGTASVRVRFTCPMDLQVLRKRLTEKNATLKHIRLPTKFLCNLPHHVLFTVSQSENLLVTRVTACQVAKCNFARTRLYSIRVAVYNHSITCFDTA